MTIKKHIYYPLIALLLCFIQLAGIEVYAQEVVVTPSDTIAVDTTSLQRVTEVWDDSDFMIIDSLSILNEENIRALEAPIDTTTVVALAANDSLAQENPVRERFIPDATRSTWMAVVFPGAGQIYNRKYWKLPIIYGGFVGCAYALSWNNKTYKDYSQAYLDIMDSDPNTNSFEDIFIGDGWTESQMKDVLKRQKDFYRRNRDLSIFAFIGVYLLSIIDAYVDAELSDFDISKDLGLKIEPAVINDRRHGNSYGLQCSIKF